MNEEQKTTPAQAEDTQAAPQPESEPREARAAVGTRVHKDEEEDDRGPRRAFLPKEPRARGRRRRKVSYLTINKIETVDYKDVALLRRFINEQGKILSSRQTGTTARQQRMIATAIRRAREMALLPFVALDSSGGDRGRGGYDRRSPGTVRTYTPPPREERAEPQAPAPAEKPAETPPEATE